jgi:hypothetical protein
VTLLQWRMGFANPANPFRVLSAITHLIPGLPEFNAAIPRGLPARGPAPRLELAKTFGVKILSGKQEVVGLLPILQVSSLYR